MAWLYQIVAVIHFSHDWCDDVDGFHHQYPLLSFSFFLCLCYFICVFVLFYFTGVFAVLELQYRWLQYLWDQSLYGHCQFHQSLHWCPAPKSFPPSQTVSLWHRWTTSTSSGRATRRTRRGSSAPPSTSSPGAWRSPPTSCPTTCSSPTAPLRTVSWATTKEPWWMLSWWFKWSQTGRKVCPFGWDLCSKEKSVNQVDTTDDCGDSTTKKTTIV